MSKSKPKPLVNPETEQRLHRLCAEDPIKARDELRAILEVKTGLKRAKLSIDAISSTTKRRTPLNHTGSLDAEFSGDYDRDKLVATSRDIFLNFSFGHGLLRQHVKNVIGTGPQLQARTDDEEFNKRAEDYWRRRKNLIDIRGLSFSQSLRVGEEREVVDGDYGLMLVEGGQTQAIEGDRIRDPDSIHKVRGRKYVSGVELNRAGAPVAYHIWNRQARLGNMKYAKRVERKNFLHCFRPERFDQARGFSWITSAVNDLQDLREVLEACKGRWKIENMLGIFIKSQMPELDTVSSLLGPTTSFTETDSDGGSKTRYNIKLNPGLWSLEGMPGDEVQMVEGKTPNDTFEAMTMLMVRMIGLVLEMPIEIALQYFTRGSYSSHRSAFNQYFDSVSLRRNEIQENKLDRLYGWVIRRAIKAGALDPPAKEVTDPTTHHWQWPGLAIIDPDKRRKGDTLGYKLGVESLADIAGRDGKDWQEVAVQRIKEQKFITKKAKEEKVDPDRVLPAVLDPGQPTESENKTADGDENGSKDNGETEDE